MAQKQVNSRYQVFNVDGTQLSLPFVLLEVKTTDKYIVWKQNINRTDKVSNLYYGIPYWGALILMANPQFGAMEYDIPDNTIIRIPYPLEATLKEYFAKAKNIKNTN